MMKNVLLSADGDIKVYSVPDIVEKNLEKIADEFSFEGGLFDVEDFIDWLNKYKYPYKKSVYIETIGCVGDVDELPDQYKNCKWYNF
ncbi:hypothetical protein [Butyrivibrio sp. ob235]|uniref:hypothetical protein n=1 Tax=Butyrivibrio sp. ob235 TaxID=1761780 RepID=UPI001587D729|nr:hypothetical protein [Butyrivibrio sp. ob235]